jgi:hypothetical protein
MKSPRKFIDNPFGPLECKMDFARSDFGVGVISQNAVNVVQGLSHFVCEMKQLGVCQICDLFFAFCKQKAEFS